MYFAAILRDIVSSSEGDQWCTCASGTILTHLDLSGGAFTYLSYIHLQSIWIFVLAFTRTIDEHISHSFHSTCPSTELFILNSLARPNLPEPYQSTIIAVLRTKQAAPNAAQNSGFDVRNKCREAGIEASTISASHAITSLVTCPTKMIASGRGVGGLRCFATSVESASWIWFESDHEVWKIVGVWCGGFVSVKQDWYSGFEPVL